jgi:TM2 domain-containing membrane protein YozV
MQKSLFVNIVLPFLFLISTVFGSKAEIVNSRVPFPLLQDEKLSLNLIEISPPHDYGDRTKLSAFILCAMLGFIGAHHFYMKRYLSGALQISFFLASTILSILGTALFFSWLFLLALWAWVAVDLLLIIFGGLRLKKGKKLIPFEQSI